MSFVGRASAHALAAQMSHAPPVPLPQYKECLNVGHGGYHGALTDYAVNSPRFFLMKSS